MSIVVHNNPIHDCCFLCQYYGVGHYYKDRPEHVLPDEPYCSKNRVALRYYTKDAGLIRTNCEYFEGVVEFSEAEVLENGWG